MNLLHVAHFYLVLSSLHTSLYTMLTYAKSYSTARVGVHSGPVTAGVLRSERSRFQLFGDTVNTAARMEQTGIRSRIHISQATADLLIAAGKEHWIKPREGMVEAKGKGKLQTYWASSHLTSSQTASVLSDTDATSSDVLVIDDQSRDDAQLQRLLLDKTKRLIEWNVDVFQRLLRQVIARRTATNEKSETVPPMQLVSSYNRTPLDEVVEIISLPKFSGKVSVQQALRADEELPQQVVDQLHSFVTSIAAM
jgi:Adenylate and Guanylate cyclase catalytic domain